MLTDIKAIKTAILSRTRAVENLERNIAEQRAAISKHQGELYKLQQLALYLGEIKRLAQIHFPRLRGMSSSLLTEEDGHELRKWVSRAESLNDLKKVMDAIAELEKYSPKAVTNIYGLVQSIIIEGAYGKRKKSKK